MLLSFDDLHRANSGESFSCPAIEDLPAASYSGPVGQRVSRAAMDMLGYEDRTNRAPDGLKCAVQVHNILRRAGVDVPFDASVVGLVAKLKKAGWCGSSTAIPGAIAYTNEEFGNGPRSHIGVVSYPVPKIASKVEQQMSDTLRQKYRFVPEFRRSVSERLTIYHNATRWIVGYPQGNYDRQFFSKAKFLVPPESCKGGR
jgi:hypothetical protein